MQVLSAYHSAYATTSVVAARARPASTPANVPAPAPTTTAPVAEERLPACPHGMTCAPGEPSSDGDARASAVSMSYRKSEKTSLTIRTQEGDVVRLRIRSRESLRLEAAHAEAAGDSSTDVALRHRSSTKLSLSVQGHLSEAELAAIQDTIERATELAEDFFDGDVQGAFESAASLGVDGDQLAAVSLRMKSRERLTYSVAGFGSRPGFVPTAPNTIGAPAEGSAQQAPAAQVPAVDAPATPSEAAPAEAADSPATEAPAPKAAPLRFDAMRAIGGFLSQVMERMADAGDAHGAGSLSLSLKLRIFESTLVTLARTEAPQDAPMPDLVPETLDALAAGTEEAEVAPRPEVDQVA